MGKFLTMIGYSIELYELAEADELYQSYDLPQIYWLTPDTVSVCVDCWMI